MKPSIYLALPVLLLFVAACRKAPQAAEASAVPLALWVDYSAGDGDCFHFIRAWDAHGEVRNEYCVNPDYDAEARYVAIHVSAESWTKFSQAVEAIDFRDMKEAYQFGTMPGKVRWSFYLEYSDRVISASSVDSPSTVADFANLKTALFELTRAGAFGADPHGVGNPHRSGFDM